VIAWAAAPARAEDRVSGPAGRPPDIRVLLMQGVTDFSLAIESPFEVREASGRLLLADAPPMERASSVAVSSGSGPALRVAGRTFSASALEIVPHQSGALRVGLPEDRDSRALRRFRGYLRCVLHGDGTVDAINVVGVEDYLKSVLRGELPPNFHPETFKAQAVAARTFALYQRQTVGRRRDWDVTATQSSQMYTGIDGEEAASKAVVAVEETRGLVCTWSSPTGQRIFCTFYSAVCGGWTRGVAHISDSPAIPPLAGGVACGHCWKAPKGFFRWGPEVLPKRVIAQQLANRFERFRQLGPAARLEVATTDSAGRPVSIRVVDRHGRAETLKAESFRLAIDPAGLTIKSTDFKLVDGSDDVVFTHGRGWGHQAGLCQWGAEGLARGGKKAAQILATYYPTSRLTKAYE